MSSPQQIILVAGLGFGDEGKGSTVDYLTRKHEAHTIIRYNGAAQVAHNVIAPDGHHHVFAQFGSGMLVPGVRTHLSRFMLINPFNMLNEEAYLRTIGVSDALPRTTIEEGAPIITPFHKAKNRLLEIARGNARHGSCGMGVGQAMEDFLQFGAHALLAKDLSNTKVSRQKLSFLQERARASLEVIIGRVPHTDTTTQELAVLHDPDIVTEYAECYKAFSQAVRVVDQSHCRKLLSRGGTVIFEGAQGVLLDRDYGFHPYKTKTDITFANAYALLNEASYAGDVVRLGVLRGYATRHGRGPFVTEDIELTRNIPDFHNGTNEWQESFRVGHFDFISARYALDVIGGVDQIMLTNLDRMKKINKIQICIAYQLASSARNHFVCDGVVARTMNVIRPSDVGHQTLLTKYLEFARPMYRECPKVNSKETAISYARIIERGINAPISIVSFGPTASDKIALNV